MKIGHHAGTIYHQVVKNINHLVKSYQYLLVTINTGVLRVYELYVCISYEFHALSASNLHTQN